jgi:hypothetical protein
MPFLGIDRRFDRFGGTGTSGSGRPPAQPRRPASSPTALRVANEAANVRWQQEQDEQNAAIQTMWENAMNRQTAADAAAQGIASGTLSLQRDQFDFGKKQWDDQLVQWEKQFGFSKEMFKVESKLAQDQLNLAIRTQGFFEKTTNTQMLLEAAGLAASPTGAIQLAYMARNQGAPAGAIADIFSNLPFVQAALKGETLPGFGVPEQLGGGTQPSNNGVTGAVGGSGGGGGGGGQSVNSIQGAQPGESGGIFERGLGVELPSLTSITQQQFEGMKDSEKLFLGALYQSETGIPIDQALNDIQKSFIPTASASRLSF